MVSNVELQGTKMKMRSRILQYFPVELLMKLRQVSDAHGVSNNEKTPKIVELLNEYHIPFDRLGNGTNRYGILIDGYAVKIALDSAGRMDNRREFKYAHNLYPYVVKVYECLEDGLIAFFEYVTIFSMADYMACQDQMRDILREISQNYLVGDIGVSSNNYVNWGTRENGEIVILDFAYIYSLSYRGFECTKCDEHAQLQFDPDYNNLVCPFCKEKYSFSAIRRRISKEDEQNEIGNIMEAEGAYKLTAPTQFVEIGEKKAMKYRGKSKKETLEKDSSGPKLKKDMTSEEAKTYLDQLIAMA